jgi:hypothetical protein
MGAREVLAARAAQTSGENDDFLPHFDGAGEILCAWGNGLWPDRLGMAGPAADAFGARLGRTGTVTVPRKYSGGHSVSRRLVPGFIQNAA